MSRPPSASALIQDNDRIAARVNEQAWRSAPRRRPRSAAAMAAAERARAVVEQAGHKATLKLTSKGPPDALLVQRPLGLGSLDDSLDDLKGSFFFKDQEDGMRERATCERATCESHMRPVQHTSSTPAAHQQHTSSTPAAH